VSIISKPQLLQVLENGSELEMIAAAQFMSKPHLYLHLSRRHIIRPHRSTS